MKEVKFKINWKNCERNELISEYFCEKVIKLMDFNFVNRTETIKAVISFLPKKNLYQTTLTAVVDHHGAVHAESEHDENIYHTINQVVDKVIDQLRRIKTKFQDKN